MEVKTEDLFIMEGERGSSVVETEETTQETTNDGAEATNDEKSNVDETKDEQTEETEDKGEKETKEDKPKDKNIQALDSERARRKKAEAKMKELEAEIAKMKNSKEDEAKINSESENLKKELLEGELLDEEIADKLVKTFGKGLIEQKIKNERFEKEEAFNKEFKQLTEDEMFYDAEEYKEEIKGLMEKGLSMKGAYFALAGENKMASIRKDLEVEIEQKLLNNTNKAERVNVGHEEAKDEAQRSRYTKRESELARETNLDVKDVHKRLQATTLDEILNL